MKENSPVGHLGNFVDRLRGVSEIGGRTGDPRSVPTFVPTFRAWRGRRRARGGERVAARTPSGVWEIRIAAGVDPVSCRTIQRSFVVHGDADVADLRRKELADEWSARRAIRRVVPFLTVEELLERWLAAYHDWRPATWISARSNCKALGADPLAQRRVASLTPEVVRAAMASWTAAGASVAVVSGRFRLLRAALGWAHVERIVDVNPLSGMRGPTSPGTRMHLGRDQIVRLLETSERLVGEAAADETRLHKAEQLRLRLRLAADSGAGAASWWRSRQATLRGGSSRSSAACRQSSSVRLKPAARAG